MTNLPTRGIGGTIVNLAAFGLGGFPVTAPTSQVGGGGEPTRRKITTVLRGFPVEPFKDGFEEFEKVASDVEKTAREALKSADVVRLEPKPRVITRADNAELIQLLRGVEREEQRLRVDEELKELLTKIEVQEVQEELLLLGDEDVILSYLVLKKLKQRIL